jgi:four helix bundle protein
MSINRKELEQRTKKSHIDVIKLCGLLPRKAAGFETAKQIIRSAGLVGANYRATKRAKSKADFIYKIEIVLEEADESHYWLEIIKEAGLITNEQIDWLLREANELTAIFAAANKTAKKNKENQTS